MELIDSWKNKEVFEKQISLNLTQLNDVCYPDHWSDFLTFMDLIKTKIRTVLDIGCGVGTYSELCKRHFPHIKYIGMDYSQEAVDLASKQWPESKFFCKDYKDISSDDLNDIDVLHACSLHNVLPNGDECLDFLLGLQAKYVILGKILLTNEDSSATTYTAYDTIQTYLYKHNYTNLKEIFNKHNYIVKERRRMGVANYLLQRGY